MTVPAPASPYKGLNAFADSELDALLFFGREREREIVAANLTASRLTVLYGPSGVGKSSLLSAAVARSMRELPEQPLVVVFSRWSDDPAGALAAAVADAEGSARNGSALEALERAQASRDVYLILDQAEEYFLYHADDAGPGSFAETLPSLLGGRNRVNVLVSLREDSLAKLDRFTGRIGGVFANTLRLDRLSRPAARAAIVRPVERFVDLTGESASVEPALVERVLDDVGTGRIAPALGGQGAVEAAPDGVLIEAPYLQLVMQRLWEEERAVGSEVLRVETLDRLGGARQIVEDHLEGALAELSEPERDVAARLFNHLVTPSGTKIAHEVSDLADFGHVTTADVQPVLSTLAGRRILRSVEEAGGVRYEIFHDVLAQPVLAWRARHRTEREVEQKLAEAHRRRRRLQLLFGLVLVALALMTGIAYFANSQRSLARRERTKAEAQAAIALQEKVEAQKARKALARQLRVAQNTARQLHIAIAKGAFEHGKVERQLKILRALRIEQRAHGVLGTDPELALVLARAAVKVAHTPTSRATLAEALQKSRLRQVATFKEPVLRAMILGKDVIAAMIDGSVVTAGLDSGQVRRQVPTNVSATSASFADDGSAVLTGTDKQLRLASSSGNVRTLPLSFHVLGGSLSADGKQVLAYNRDGARLLDLATGRIAATFPHAHTRAAALSSDGTLAATAHADGTLWVWSTATGDPISKISKNVGDTVALAISPHDRFVANANATFVARVWHRTGGPSFAPLAGHTDAITDIEFSPDGRYVVTASHDGTMRIGDLSRITTPIVLHDPVDFDKPTLQVRSAAFVTAAKIVSTDRNEVRLWDTRPPQPLKVHGTLRELVAQADKRLAATGRRLTPAEKKSYRVP